MNKFTQIKISDWQQFKDIEIDFHDRLTIITGANGSGKTTILNILARHFGWSQQSLAVPKKNFKTKAIEWVSRFLNLEKDVIGQIYYSNIQTLGNSRAVIKAPQATSASYQINIETPQAVDGFFIPSHKTAFRYQPVQNLAIRTSFDKDQAFSLVSSSLQQHYMGGAGQPSSFHMKDVLISWNIIGHGNPDMPGKPDLLSHFNDFEKVLKIILPPNLGFNKLEVRDFEIVLCCDLDNDFIIDAASGGISALIDLAWQVHMFSTEQRTKFFVVIDEVENHLHPAMQRRVLPDLLRAFPKASFIVTTHSPLIVGSVKESTVIALRYKEGKIYSEKLDLVNQVRTATEILDDILGVSFTMPIWAEEALVKITNKYLSKDSLSSEDLKNMRNELDENGLGRLMPEAITKIALEKND